MANSPTPSPPKEADQGIPPFINQMDEFFFLNGPSLLRFYNHPNYYMISCLIGDEDIILVLLFNDTTQLMYSCLYASDKHSPQFFVS